MKINKNLLIVLLIASLGPALYFRIRDWVNGDIVGYYDFFESLLINSLISVVVTLSISWVILSILGWLNRRFPWNENALKRLTAEIVFTFPAALMLGYLFGSITYPLNYHEDQTYSQYIFSFLGISGIMNFVLVAVSDWFYFFQRWKFSLIEKQKAITDKEILQKEKVVAQYEVLKNQINPHFLFNSLNVLSSLIHRDVDKAEEFIDEFASLYRYILEHNEHAVVPLKEEMAISKSYAYLQEIRFGEAIQFDFRLTESEMDEIFIFPLSVQTLLENAVKHNASSPEAPLQIEVYLEKDCLLVKNNLYPREHSQASTGIGIQNLKMRYRAYKMVPTFEKNALHYLASLPLLHTSQLSREETKPKSE